METGCFDSQEMASCGIGRPEYSRNDEKPEVIKSNWLSWMEFI
jgi:hypothetical protein